MVSGHTKNRSRAQLLWATLQGCSSHPHCSGSNLGSKGPRYCTGHHSEEKKTISLGGLHMVLSLQMYGMQEWGRLGRLCLDFRGCLGKPGCPGRRLPQGQNAHRETLLGKCQGKMWDSSLHTESQPWYHLWSCGKGTATFQTWEQWSHWQLAPWS